MGVSIKTLCRFLQPLQILHQQTQPKMLLAHLNHKTLPIIGYCRNIVKGHLSVQKLMSAIPQMGFQFQDCYWPSHLFQLCLLTILNTILNCWCGKDIATILQIAYFCFRPFLFCLFLPQTNLLFPIFAQKYPLVCTNLPLQLHFKKKSLIFLSRIVVLKTEANLSSC